MAGNGLELSGLAGARARLMRARRSGPVRLKKATEAALTFLEKKAKQILDEEIYSKSHGDDPDPPDKSDSDSLYNHFFSQLSSLARTETEGTVGNDSEHALFLEFGTDDEGTGSHFVPVVSGAALHWINPMTGQASFSKGHEVKGIVPIRFMERALKENRAEVTEIFRQHFEGLFAG